jgi:hypothetical protein
MKCPQCGEDQYCPCSNCKDSYSKGKKTWIWIDGELIKCAGCGLTKHADWWMDAEWKEFKANQAAYEAGVKSNNKEGV